MANRLRELKYGENKAPHEVIDESIASIQAECLLVANDKSDYNEPHAQEDGLVGLACSVQSQPRHGASSNLEVAVLTLRHVIVLAPVVGTLWAPHTRKIHWSCIPAAPRPVGVRWLLHATLKGRIPGGVGWTAPRVATDAIHPMVDLTDGRGPPALATKVLGQGDGVWHRVAERRGEGPRFGRVWSAASQEGLPGR